MRILIAEDDAVSALLLERTLKKGGYEVAVTRNGAEALDALRSQTFDALLTDWMMPNVDGIELTRRVRATVEPQPLIMVVTALASEEARAHALEAGADDYLAKPVEPRDVLERLANCFRRRAQPQPEPPRVEPALAEAGPRPPFVGVALVASTGGPTAVTRLVRDLPPGSAAAWFVVLHGPEWLLETFVLTLRRETPLDVRLARHGEVARPGTVYVAPGERHLTLTPGSLAIELRSDPPENFVRPAADPLFRSVARAFGRYSVAVVLTGMGRDGSLGAAEVAAAGGVVLVQDPKSAIASSMPRTVIDLGVARRVLGLDELADGLRAEIEALSETLGGQ